MNDDYILLFDGVCNLCNSVVQFVIVADKKKKIKFAPLQSEHGQSLLKKYQLPTDDFQSFVLFKKGRYYLKSSAVLHVLKELGSFWRLFYIFIIIPAPIRDFFYQIVARTRYRIFGKRDSCMIPTPELLQRFLT
jgi:predicted DCC family thiol-disulfide oxidoreductase YuxK